MKNNTVRLVEARNRLTTAPIFLLTQKGRPRRNNAVGLNCEKLAPFPLRHFFRLTVTWQRQGYGSVKFVSTWRCDLSRSKSMQLLSQPSCWLKVASINRGRFQYHFNRIDRHNIARVFTLIGTSCKFMQFVRDKNWIKLRRQQRITYKLVLWNNVTDAISGRHFLTTRSPISFRWLLSKPMSDWPH